MIFEYLGSLVSMKYCLLDVLIFIGGTDKGSILEGLKLIIF